MTARTEIKEALDTVPGITGYEFMPTMPIEGDAWPNIDSWNWPNQFGAVVTWSIFVCLGTDQIAAEQSVSALLSGVVTALSDVVYVKNARPQLTTFGDSRVLYTLVISAIREDD